MKKIEIEDFKKIQVEILDVVAEFCEKNDIKYWLDCGTLLGAIRHKGFIPWDDDIDIGMLRKDYQKFMDLFNKENTRYKFFCNENNSDFLYPFGKILDTNTVLYEPDEKGNKISVYIDLFVYDNAPDDDKMVNKMFKIRDINNIFSVANITHHPRGNIFRRHMVHILRLMLKPFPKNLFIKNMVKNSKKYINAETKRVGNFMSYSKVVCDRNILMEFTKAEFEGKLYPVPLEYDKWLTLFYGDYMKLPPVEKRVSHHKIKAFYM